MSEVRRDDLISYLDDLLDVGDENSSQDDDYCPNGLQIEGRPTIRRLITAVSSCRELFEQARAKNADACLVHHGLFWYGDSPILTGIQAARVREVFAGGLNLIAYHLPLDRDPVYGNNALAAKAFGLVEIEPFAETRGFKIGFKGRFPEPISVDELRRRVDQVYRLDIPGWQALHLPGGPNPVRTFGIISGGSQGLLHHAVSEGLDAFITGEATEWVMNFARESGIHYFAAGHYATEILGVRALGEHLAPRFGIEVEFLDIPNPV